LDGFERRLEQAFAAEAGVALAAVRVEDPEGRPATWRSGPVAGHEDLGPLADDIPPEVDPRSAGQLEADPGRLADGCRDARHESRRLEDDEADPSSPGERREPAEAIGDASGALKARREIDDQEVDGPAGEQRAGHREALLGVGRGQDHEPLRPDTAGHGLDGIERGGEIQPGRDRAGRLSLRDEPQGERGPPAREVTPERQAQPTGQAARPQDRVEAGEPGREDPRPIWLLGVGNLQRECQPARLVPDLAGHRRERADDLTDPRGSGRAPLRPEGRQGRRHVGGERRHRRDYRTSVRMNQ
jgi:hypothetical protein